MKKGREAEKVGGIRGRLRILLLACGLVLLIVLLLFLLPKPSSMEKHKATWLWDTSMIEDNTNSILSFCEEQGVDVIFLQVQKKVTLDHYRSFITAATTKGISVHALDGTPDWAYKKKRSEGNDLLKWVIDYNNGSVDGARFTGIQFDVEPYQLQRWKRDQNEVVREWSDNMDSWIAEGSSHGLYMSAAVPFWLDETRAADGSESLSRWMIRKFDAVAVMSYRDSGQGMYDLARNELKQADKLGKSVWIGLELARSKEGAHVSFFRKDVPIMEEEMKTANRLGEEHPSFAGIAVHHYEEWQSKVASTESQKQDRK
ncbi:hypothetical protein [Paenibacillus pini]|uniref:Uncharacterized protein n=1 Tax=Paenibacillus pini JCM 16418 TaxID=1236976 RepID=W7YXS7_9BACL|nr:hypothetical protein JCM16418_1208 [Paenibacillus pini JCM 16418]